MKKVLYAVLIVLAMAIVACADEPVAAPTPLAQRPAGMPFAAGQNLYRTNPVFLSPLSMVRVPPVQFVNKVKDALKLSEDQRKKADEVWSTYLAKSDAALKQSQETAKALDDALHASPVDEKAVKEALAKSLKAEEQLATVCIDYWTGFRSNLTPEQDKKLAGLMQSGSRQPAPANTKRLPLPANTNTVSTPSAPEKPADK